MRKNVLFFGGILALGITGSIILFNKADSTSLYKARKAETPKGIAGALQYYFDIKKNPETNSIDYRDVYNTIQQINQRPLNKAASLGLEWTELGPDNVGGRTRALLIDKNDPNKMFAGGVAGGLWISTDGGANWSVYTAGTLENIAVTCITQAANGDIYFGTGEGLYFQSGEASGGIVGGGIWKSTDGGESFSRLVNTIPAPNSNTGAWVSVNQLAAHPTNANRIYAGTNYGLMLSDDGGNTWNHPIRTGGGGFPNTNKCYDVDMASDGAVIVAMKDGKEYYSATGDSGTFTNVYTFSDADRVEYAFAPSDNNYVYASAAKGTGYVSGIYQSIDKGQTWTMIGQPGSTSGFTPFGTVQGQGDYDNAVAVFPNDKGRIILGGVELWSWKQLNPGINGVGQWTKMAFETEGYIVYKRYVHADKHTIKFHPTKPNTFYIGTDGGVFRSTDGGATFTPMNKGFNITQCYSVAFEGNGTGVMAGNQDNGTQYIDGSGNTAKWAKEIKGGDGGDVEISFLNPKAFFAESQYGSLARSSDKGDVMEAFYSTRMNTLNLSTSFITPFALYENYNATNSSDSLLFIASRESKVVGIGDASKLVFSGTLVPKQASASIVPDSVKIKSGGVLAEDDAAGNLTGTGIVSGSINHATGEFTITFSTPPSNGLPVIIDYAVTYNSGSVLNLISKVSSYPFNHTLLSSLASGDSIRIQDLVQSKFAIGFSGTAGIWMTKEPLDFSKTPEWFKIAEVSGTPQSMAWSPDGDILYVGTGSGNLYRISNLTAIVDSVSGDLGTAPSKLNPNYKQVKTQIAGFVDGLGGRFITGLYVDPNNGNRLVVTLGGYGGSTNVFFTDSAATCPTKTNNANFTSKQGTLPAMPVYDAIIEKNNPNTVILATEYGIYATNDITQVSPVWSEENLGKNPSANGNFMMRVPTFRIRQQTLPYWNVSNSGVIYIGTHGRGMWKCETYKQDATTGINHPNASLKVVSKPVVTVYPNPLNGNGYVTFTLSQASQAVIRIYDLQGKEVQVIRKDRLPEGKQTIAMDSNELPVGTYLLSLDADGTSAVTKFIVTK